MAFGAGQAVGLGEGALTSLYGLFQLLSSNHKLKNLDVPNYNIPQEYGQNVNFASQLYNQPINPFYTENIERNLGSTIGATLQGGGNLGQVTDTFGQGNDAFKQLMLAHEQERLQKAQFLTSARDELAQQKLYKQSWEQFQPYQRAYDRYSAMSNAGAQNISTGLNTIGSSLIPFGGGGSSPADNQRSSGSYSNYDWSSTPDWLKSLIAQYSTSTPSNPPGQNYNTLDH